MRNPREDLPASWTGNEEDLKPGFTYDEMVSEMSAADKIVEQYFPPPPDPEKWATLEEISAKTNGTYTVEQVRDFMEKLLKKGKTKKIVFQKRSYYEIPKE